MTTLRTGAAALVCAVLAVAAAPAAASREVAPGALRLAERADTIVILKVDSVTASVRGPLTVTGRVVRRLRGTPPSELQFGYPQRIDAMREPYLLPEKGMLLLAFLSASTVPGPSYSAVSRHGVLSLTQDDTEPVARQLPQLLSWAGLSPDARDRAVLGALRSDGAMRRLGAEWLAAAGHETGQIDISDEVVTALLALLRDPDRYVQAGALECVGIRLTEPPPRLDLLPAVVEGLDNPIRWGLAVQLLSGRQVWGTGAPVDIRASREDQVSTVKRWWAEHGRNLVPAEESPKRK